MAKWRVFEDRIKGDRNCGAMVLDGHSELEVTLGVLGGLILTGSLTLGLISLDKALLPPGIVWSLLATGVLILAMRFALDDRYRLDFGAGKVQFERKILGWTQRRNICDFSELAAVAVSSRQASNKYGSWWEYGLTLVLKNGTLVAVVPERRTVHGDAAEDGATLATELNVKLHRGKPEQLLTVETGPLGPKLTYKPYVVSNATVFAVVALLVLLSAGVMMAIAWS